MLPISHDRQRLLSLFRSVIASTAITAVLMSPPLARADAMELFVENVLDKPLVDGSSSGSDIVQEHRDAAQQFVDCCLIGSRDSSRIFETDAEEAGDPRTASDRFREDVLLARKR